MGEQQIKSAFMSKTVLDTLKVYDDSLLIPSKLLQSVGKIPKSEMLRNKNMRNVLIQSIREDDDVNTLAKILGIKSNKNNRQELLKIKISENSEKEKKLFKFFDVEHVTKETVAKHSELENIVPERPLFAHQRIAIDEIEQYLNSNPHAALLHMPTGSGKTRTAMRIISNIFIKDKPTIVIWIALTEELCEQAISEFQQTWNTVGDRDITAFRFFGGYSPDILHELENKKEGFIVASMSKLDYAKNDQFLTTLADKVQLVIMDEAHHATATTYKKTIEILTKHRTTKLLGLSATPGRTLEKNDEDLKLATFFGSNKATLKIDGLNPIRFLIENKYIAEPHIDIIEHQDKLTAADKRQISKKYLIPESILNKLSADVIRNTKIVDAVEELVNNGQKRIIVFTPSIQSSRDIAMILSAKNLQSYYVDSHLSDQLRAEIIQKYKNDTDETMILCNVNILTAGFDAPRTSAVVIARPTKSLVMYSQMIGRAIRGEKVGGNKDCFIKVITDKSIMEFKNIALAFEHWESEWNQ